MSVVAVQSNLSDVPMEVVGISEFIEKRTTNITYERSRTKTFGIARGARGLRVRAKIRSDDDYQMLRDLFDADANLTAFFDARQRPLYIGDYVLGDMESDDETHSTPHHSVSFTLYELPDGLNMASIFDTVSTMTKPLKEGNLSWKSGTVAPSASARGNLVTNTASAQNISGLFDADSTSATDPTSDATAFTIGDKLEIVGWVTPTGFSDLSANQLMGFRIGDSTAVFDKTTTAQHNVCVGADSTGALYLVTADGSTVTPTAMGVTAVSGTRFKLNLVITVGTSVRAIINSAFSKTNLTSVPNRFNTVHLGWGTSGAVAGKSAFIQGDMFKFTSGA